MRERCGVEVELDAVFKAPLYPALEVFGRYLVAVNESAAEVAVYFVEVEAVLAGNQAHGIQNVGAELVDIAGLAGVVAVYLNAACEAAALVFKAGNVVGLPAVHAQVEILHQFEYFVGIDAYGGIAFACYLICTCDEFAFHVFGILLGFISLCFCGVDGYGAHLFQ